MNLLRRYRAYLRDKASQTEPPRVLDMQWHLLPWLLPVAIWSLVEFYFQLSGPFISYLWLFLIGVFVIGLALVGWAFLVDATQFDLNRYRTEKNGKRKR